MTVEASASAFRRANTARVAESSNSLPLTRAKAQKGHDGGWLKAEVISPLSLAPRKRCEYGVGLPDAGKWNGLEVQAWLERGKKVMVWGWPVPIRITANVELPPLRYRPTHGPRARQEARRLRAEAERQGIELGRPTRRYLRQVVKGELPLQLSKVRGIAAYLARTLAERERVRRPLRLTFGPNGPQVLWRRTST